MKKYLIIATAFATLASCTKNASLEVAPVTEDEAIAFSAYAETAATKGMSVDPADVIATEKGIGVFAFYQPATNKTPNKFNSTKFSAPDYMYDTQVKPDAIKSVLYANVDEYNAAKGTSLTAAEFTALTDAQKTKYYTADNWTYSPLKYWPNNEGDLLSFFAYTPYDENKSWEDLGFKTDVIASKLTASFPICNEKVAMKDYVFAAPALNKSKQTLGGAKINFDFKHITSKVAINVGVVVDNVPAAGPKAWTDPNTVITVESVEIKGIAESFDYSCPIKADGTLGTPEWKASGSQNLFLTAKAGDFQNNVINSTTFEADGWKTLLANEGVSADKAGYLFIAPQDLTTANMVITYTVATTSPKNPADNSTITNVIEKPIGVNFLSGKAYALNLLIGMKTVELSATVTSWDDTTYTTQIDVPATEGIHYIVGDKDYGSSVKVGDVIWAPVNCGYDPVNFKYGKLYQYARAVGCGYVSASADATIDDAGGIIQAYDNSGRIQEPADDKFYKGDSDGCWYKGGSSLGKWPMKSTDSQYLAGKIDNPCPAGWRVPTEDELGNLFYTNWNSSTNKGTTERGKWDSDKKGWNFQNGLFFPAAGERLRSDGKCGNRGSTGFYWSSCYNGTSYVASYCFSFSASTAAISEDARAAGYSVRCVYIQE